MMHVCVDARLYSASGIGTFLKSSIEKLASSSSCKLTVLCRKEEKERLRRFSQSQIIFSSPIYSLKEQAEYPVVIPSCDLFWSPHFNIPLLPIRAKKRLVTICDVFHLAHFSSLTLPQKAYAKILYEAACKLSHQVTTLSDFSKNEILKFTRCPSSKLTLLSPGFSFTATPQTEKKDFLLYVGNLKPHKNLAGLVQAYAKIKPPEPLYIVGKKEGLITPDSKIHALVEQDPFLKRQCHFTGFLPEEELKVLYASAKLFVFPSTYEGYGYPPLEAMASGCPVLSSTAGSLPEVCDNAAEYMDPFSIPSIEASLNSLLINEKRRLELIQKGYERTRILRERANSIVEVIDACCHRA